MDWDKAYQLLHCESETQLTQVFTQQLNDLGIQYFGYFVLSNNPEQSPVIIGNYPENWTNQYIERNYMDVDTTVALCCMKVTPFTWGMAKKLNMDPKSIEFWQEAKQHQIEHGVSVPIHINTQQKVGIGCSILDSNEASWLNQYGKHLAVLSTLYHQQRESLVHSPDRVIKQLKLTHRELECGKWVCAGYTLDQVALKTRISERTVRFHLDKLKQKLGVSTREQVIVKLIAYGLVTP